VAEVLFGKIDYINLAPFHVYLKRHIKNSRFKQSIEYKKSYPSHINKLFKRRQVDAAFISSIESRRGNFRCYDAGIVAHREIRSVLVKRGAYRSDSESATSNALAKRLGIDGEVIIGDKALRAWLENPSAYEDLAALWYAKYRLPFVFARFCVNRHHDYYRGVIRGFLRARTKIPLYMLRRYADRSGIPVREIRSYLKLVHYEIDHHAARGLEKFLKR
jgi:chorismate dehydratase